VRNTIPVTLKNVAILGALFLLFCIAGKAIATWQP
jgi:hypothetical protein